MRLVSFEMFAHISQNTIAERDETIADALKQIAERDSLIAEQGSTISDLQDQVSSLTEKVQFVSCVLAACNMSYVTPKHNYLNP